MTYCYIQGQNLLLGTFLGVGGAGAGVYRFKLKLLVLLKRRDIQLNDLQPKDILHNFVQYKEIQNNGIQLYDLQYKDIQYNEIRNNGIQLNDLQYKDIQHNDFWHNNKKATLSIISLSRTTLDAESYCPECRVSLCQVSLWWLSWRLYLSCLKPRKMFSLLVLI